MTEVHKFLTDLENNANAATPGPWHVVTDEDRSDSAYAVCAATPMFIPFSGINRKHDSSFIAAANPEAVKRLVAMTRLTIDALIHIRDKKPAWCRNECNPCRPECVARHVIDAIMHN